MGTILLALLMTGGPDAGVKNLAVDNRKLFDDYNANQLSADKKYKNQILDVTAILDQLELDEEGGIVLHLVTRNPFMRTYAALETAAAKNDDRIEKLTKGDKVIITCVCVGRNQGVPVLGGCVLQKAFRSTPQ